MRDLCVLNLACNYCNLHLFDAQRHIISHQHSQDRFVCACVAHIWKTYVAQVLMAMCVVHLCVCAHVCV